jgi:sialate O-acetylesterase
MIEFALSALFNNHMVLQRQRTNPVWGWDRPQQTITLRVERPPSTEPIVSPVSVVAGPDGSWRIDCPELPAGGPYRVRLKGSSERTIEDVLVGEVWLASGQSNMEWNLSATDGAEADIAAAHLPQIRQAYVQHAATSEPQRNAQASWRVCSPESAGQFSAVGYHFARELHQRLGVPVGIINSSWGGTRVEAWTSVEALRPVMDVDTELARARNTDKPLAQLKSEYDARVAAWAKSVFPTDTGNEGEASGWATEACEPASWKPMNVPGAWQHQGLKHNGAIWFRRTVEIPAAWAGRDLELSLGVLDDFDCTYFNGQRVGAHPQGTPDAHLIARRYVVTGAVVKAGASEIAVRIFDHFGEGGFLGQPNALFLKPARISPGDTAGLIPLAGRWLTRVERVLPLASNEIFKTHPAPPTALEVQNHPGALFNGMIAPLIPYGIRGAIWYQGESNVGSYASYHERFTAMIRDWRTRWGVGHFPFLFVQLANFRDTPGWAYLREAQARTLAEPATGMAVTIDIGDAGDIHPRNKRDVGSRMARIALADTYGVDGIVSSGPQLSRVEIAGKAARVFLTSAAGLRARDRGAAIKGFALAGADGKFHPAGARIEKDVVVLTSENVLHPIAVRYAWADDPDANLENEAGLPAAPFRTDGW